CTCAPGEIIILEGEPSRYVYFVAEGQARSVRTAPDGREQVLAWLRPGNTFNTVPPFLPQAGGGSTEVARI
ncbi:MAG: Crp/Fnr family transcriptional regulator, partial [Anaerolineae bacterium]